MKQVSVSTPGKALVSGEYAVLAGAPAVSMAINRRAIVRIIPGNEKFHCVSTPGHADGSWRFSSSDGVKIDWADLPPAKGLRLVEEAWRITSVGSTPPLSIFIDTREFFDSSSGKKLGLGSSAAAMTALVTALCQFGPHSDNAGILSQRAHSALQDGLGSGVDIATSFHGGVIEYRMDDNTKTVHRRWPDSLAYQLLWSGQPAVTAARISKLTEKKRNDTAWVALVDAAEVVASTWAAGQPMDIIAALKNYTTALSVFSNDRDLGIFDAGHGKLAALAATGDIVYKPCGAGGGDIGMVLATDAAAVARFCAQAEKRGFCRLSGELDAGGVQVSVEELH